jgi:hypothetical protein
MKTRRSCVFVVVSQYRMGDIPTFVIKRDTSIFVMGDRIGDATAFVIKGNTHIETCVSFTCIIKDEQ